MHCLCIIHHLSPTTIYLPSLLHLNIMANTTATLPITTGSDTRRPAKQIANVETGETVGSKRGGQGKAVKSGVMMDNIEEEDTDNDIDDMPVEEVQIGVDSLDIAAHRAIFSLNRINLRKPPLPLTFGKWNSRPLRLKLAKDLLNTMKSQETRPFRLQNMIPIIISRSDVDPACLNMEIQAVSTSPMLKLSESGRHKVSLGIAGGQHRYHAIKLATDDVVDEIAKLQDTIRVKELMEMETEDSKVKWEARVKEMRRVIEEKERFVEGISIWGVILYDEGKAYCRKNSDMH
jgi:hypothetical protein